MASPDDEENGHRSPASERTPLLNGSPSGSLHKSNGAANGAATGGATAAAAAAAPDAVAPAPVDDDDDDGVAVEFSTSRTLSIMLVVWFGTAISAIDATVITTLSASISSSFHSLPLLAWLASSYVIASAAVLPVVGKLTDIFGRRAGLLTANACFAVGNLVCGLAPSEGVMLLGRVVAGLGGGGMNALSTVLASDLVPLRRRGIWQGYGNLSFGLGAALGSVVGGLLNDTVGWRWAFLLMFPFTLLSAAGIFFLVKIPVKEHSGSRLKRIDFAGALSLIASVVVLLVGLNAGGNTLPWSHPVVLAALPLAAVLFATFLFVETRVAVEPIIPVGLLGHRTVAASCVTVCLATMAFYALIFYVPLYLQVYGLSAAQTGLRSITSAVGVGVGSFATGFIMNHTGRYWWLNVGVEATMIAGFVLVATFDLGTPSWVPFLSYFVCACGFAGMLTTTMVALIAAVEHRFQAVVTSASYSFRMTGGVVGITLASAVFQNCFRAGLEARLGGLPGAHEIIPKIRASLDYLKELPAAWRAEALGAYMDALRMVFVSALGLACAAGLASLLMREHKLYKSISRSD